MGGWRVLPALLDPTVLLRACVLVLAGVVAPQLISFPTSAVLPMSLFLLLVAALPWRCRRDLLLAGFGVLLFVGSVSIVLDRQLDASFEGDSVLVDVRIVDFPRANGQVVRFVAAPIDSARLPARLSLGWFEPAVELKPGDVWRLELRLRRPRGNANPGGADIEGRFVARRIGATGYVVNGRHNRLLDAGRITGVAALRAHLDARIARVVGNRDAAAVLAAIGIGARHRLSADQWERYAATGTSHLMAISGLHVGLAAVSAYTLGILALGAGGRSLHPHDIAVIAGLVVATGYALLSGFALPARRATMMLAVAAIALLRRREADGMNILALVALLVCLTDPLATMSAAFRLSFAAVAILLLVARRYVAGAGHWLRRPVRAVSRLGHVQIVLFLGLLPLTALSFARLSLSAPWVNLVAVPVFGIVTVPLTLAGLVLDGPFELAGNALLQLAAASVAGVERLIAVAGEAAVARPLPGFTLAAFPLLILPLVWVIVPPGLPGRWLAWLGVLGIAVWRPPPLSAGCVNIDVLDVGQGLAVTARTAGHALLYDTGPAFRGGGSSVRSVIAPFLVHHGIDALDRVMVSHADLDHAGGIEDLLDVVAVGRIDTGEPDELTDVDDACTAGAAWNWDGVRFDVLHPPGGATYTGNDASCVLLISAGQHRLLLTGDIEAHAEAYLLRGRGLPTVDVVVVPHHGSRTSSSRPFARALSPDVAVVSSGFGNRWGFPAADVVARWRSSGAIVLNTADAGAISVRMCADDTTVAVRRYRQTRSRPWHRADRSGH